MGVTSSDRQAGQKLGTLAAAPALPSGTPTPIQTRASGASIAEASRDTEKAPLLQVKEERRVTEDVLQDVDVFTLLHWDDLPPWQRNNVYVLIGHRRASASHLASLRSIFRIHNETVNIWAHMLGSVAFGLTGLVFWLQYDGREDVDQSDVRAVLVYFVGCVVCFAVSSVYHISLDHSETVRCVTCQADYLSIVAPLLGTTLSSTHFGFRCEPRLQAVYSPLAIFFALMCAIATLHPVFSNPAGPRVRTALYCLLGIASFAPIVHGVLLHGFREQNWAMSLGWYVALGCCHAMGAALYAVKWPERWYPRTFDLLGSSHQLMHILVVCGAVCYSVGILKAFEHAQGRM